MTIPNIEKRDATYFFSIKVSINITAATTKEPKKITFVPIVENKKKVSDIKIKKRTFLFLISTYIKGRMRIQIVDISLPE